VHQISEVPLGKLSGRLGSMQVELVIMMRTVETLQGMALGQDLWNSVVVS
jgi:hypothetical protein